MARGDDDFVTCAQASSARLQRAAYLLTGDPHQAEEAAQATLVRVYAAWGRVSRMTWMRRSPWSSRVPGPAPSTTSPSRSSAATREPAG